ncbi:MAG TPA: hypothetical protein VHJ20_11170 [Polyangia bacterium]|nr:hypothetical protein [Polyangia bacterium]
MTSFASRTFVALGLLSAFAFGCGSSKKSTNDGSTDSKTDAPTGDGPTDSAVTDAGGDALDAGGDVVTDGGLDQSGDGSSDAGSDASTDGGPDGGPVATMFLSHGHNDIIYRYNVSPGKDPALTDMIAASGPEGLAMSAKGELFAASEDGSVLRFTAPLGTPIAGTPLTGLGVTQPEQIAFVDDELWIPTTNYNSCDTTASKITRVAFDGTGAGSVAGTVTAAGIVTAGRGVLWDGTSRTLYLGDCHSVDTIQPYHVATDKTLTALAATTTGLDNPHGMALSSWGELFVSNANTNEVLRFTVGASGALTANGSLTGNGLNYPIGLAFTSWGELLVVDQGSASVSRFTFTESDGGHAPTAAGVFATGLESAASTHYLGWILVAPGASTAPANDGGVDAAPDAPNDAAAGN